MPGGFERATTPSSSGNVGAMTNAEGGLKTRRWSPASRSMIPSARLICDIGRSQHLAGHHERRPPGLHQLPSFVEHVDPAVNARVHAGTVAVLGVADNGDVFLGHLLDAKLDAEGLRRVGRL